MTYYWKDQTFADSSKNVIEYNYRYMIKNVLNYKYNYHF